MVQQLLKPGEGFCKLKIVLNIVLHVSEMY